MRSESSPKPAAERPRAFSLPSALNRALREHAAAYNCHRYGLQLLMKYFSLSEHKLTMVNLKLNEWFEMINPLALMALTSGFKTSAALQSVADTFAANCNRVLFAQRFPTLLFNAGRLFQIAESLAANELEKNPFKYAKQHHTCPPPSVRDLRTRYVTEKTKPPIVPAALTVHEDLQEAIDRHESATEIELLMCMQLTFAWTTFETLLGDLLKVAIGDDPSKRNDKKGKPLDINNYYLARFRGDRSLLSGYADTFHLDATDINKSVQDERLLALFAVRNLIAHKAGICDDKYVEYMKLLPRIPQLAIGERLVLNGKIMCDLLPPATDCCIYLLHYVDVWLASHP